MTNRLPRPTRAPRAARRRQRGLNLIEVLTAVLLFSIGLIALVGLQSRATKFSMSAEDTNRAALMANELASELQLNRSPTLSEARLAAWQERVADPTADGLPNGVLTYSAAASTVDLTITWQAPGAATANRYKTQVIIQ